MGLDDIKGKIEDFVDENAEKISEGIEKAGDFIDEKTGGKHADKIDAVQDKAQDAVDSIANDDK